MYCVEGRTLGEAWEKSIVALLSAQEATWCMSAEGRSREIPNVVMQVHDPLAEPRLSLAYPFAASIIEEYSSLVFQPFRGLDSPNQRIYRWDIGGGKRLNQITTIIDKLKKTPSSRTAIVCFWNPPVDLFATFPLAPCLMYFSIRRQRLDLSVIVRSNDAWFAAPANFVAFTELQSEVASKLDLAPGSYCHQAFSYHIYEFDVPRAAKLLDTHFPRRDLNAT
jgi:hypothetical protein